nr:uncharacterized protein LOC109171083 [Ipomoea batatas]
MAACPPPQSPSAFSNASTSSTCSPPQVTSASSSAFASSSCICLRACAQEGEGMRERTQQRLSMRLLVMLERIGVLNFCLVAKAVNFSSGKGNFSLVKWLSIILATGTFLVAAKVSTSVHAHGTIGRDVLCPTTLQWSDAQSGLLPGNLV